MADPTTNTPVAPNPAPAPVAPQTAPDLSALANPGASAPAAAPTQALPASTVQQPQAPAANAAPTVMAQIQPFEQNAQNATNTATKLANAGPATAPPMKHARLLSMVQGLAVGLGAFGTAIATHGKEGGAPEVQQYEEGQQQMKLQQQEAAQQQLSFKVSQQMAIADTNRQTAQNIILLSTLPTDLKLKDLALTNAQQQQAITQADFRAGHMGLSPDEFNSAMSGGTGQTDEQTSSLFRNRAQQAVNLAVQNPELGPNDPYVKNMRTLLQNPSATPKDLWMASQQLEGETQGKAGVTAAQTATNTAAANAPFGPAKVAQLNAALLNRYRVLNPNATALPAGYSLDANSTPNDFNRIDKVMQQGENAQATKANRDIVNAMRAQTLALTTGGGVGTGDQTKTGTAYIATLSPARASEVRAIGEGRIETNSNTFRSPAGQALLADVTQAYPNFDQSRATAYTATRKDFTSGKTAAGINSLNTVSNHLSRMYDHTNAVSTLPGVSNVARFFGNEQAAALKSDRQAVATELAKAYANGQISEGEVKEWNDKLNVSSPLELRNNIKEIATLLDGKLTSYQNQWANGMPVGVVAPIQIVSPAARASLDHIGGKSSGTTQNNPAANPSVPASPAAEAPQKFTWVK